MVRTRPGLGCTVHLCASETSPVPSHPGKEGTKHSSITGVPVPCLWLALWGAHGICLGPHGQRLVKCEFDVLVNVIQILEGKASFDLFLFKFKNQV